MTEQRQVRIVNSKGLHARASAKFVSCAANHNCQVTVNYGEKFADGTSLIQLMLLSPPIGAEITLSAQGPGSQLALEALSQLVATGFGEL